MSLRVDDSSILDNDLLWRRILDQPAWWTKDVGGVLRPSSASFLDRETGEVSVQLAKLTTIDKSSNVIKSAGIAEIKVVIPRNLGLIVASDPLLNQIDISKNDESHTLICPTQGRQITKSQARSMAKAAQMIILPKSQR